MMLILTMVSGHRAAAHEGGLAISALAKEPKKNNIKIACRILPSAAARTCLSPCLTSHSCAEI